MAITGILLAAGDSRRFGSDKLVYPLANGIPLAVASARLLKAAVDNALAVVRPQAKILADWLREEGLEVVTGTQAEMGLGASLACGVTASLRAQAWVIALADMPFIQVATVQTLVNLLRQGGTIVAPQYQGKRGHPVGFSQQFATQLRHLRGDRGARTLLQQYPVHLFDCEDPGILWDIDTPQDLLVQ